MKFSLIYHKISLGSYICISNVSRTPSVYVPPLMSEPNFHTHTELYNSNAAEYVLLTQGKIKWLMFVESSVPLDELFTDLHIPFDCELVVAQQSGNISLTEVYRIQRHEPLQTYRVSYWSSGGGFVWTDTPFFKRRGDLKGLRIRGSLYPQVRWHEPFKL
jgi:hypothetical protein